MEIKIGLLRICTRIAWKRAPRAAPTLPATLEEPEKSVPEPISTPFVYDPSLPTPLLSLPNELILLIASFLPQPPDLNALLRTNRRMANLFGPLALQSLECSITALCWAVLTSNKDLMVLLLSNRGPGFVLSDPLGTVVYPTDGYRRVGNPKVMWIFVVGPKLRISVPGRLEGEVTVRGWAESHRFVKLLSYCWSTDQVRGEVWANMVKEGL